MKRFVLAVFCCAGLLVNAGGTAADPVFDRDMATSYLQAAQAGNDDAQFYLAALYSAGVGVPRSDEEAFRWFSGAAEQGHSHAMLILSGLYAVGRGVPKDNIKAYKWAYIVGSASRVEEFRNGARQLIGLLESRMIPEEINLAKGDASRWRAAPGNRPAQTVTPAALQPAPVAPAPAAPAPAAPASPAPTVTAAVAQPAPPRPAAPAAQPARKSDANLMDQIPALRKKFGF